MIAQISPEAASAPDETPNAQAKGSATAVHVIPAKASFMKAEAL